MLWDSQAGQPIFANRSLLRDVGPHPKPFCLHGIHRDAPGLEVTECGTFSGLAGIGYSPHAAANVLSMPAAVDAGVRVSYDPTLDVYDVNFPTGTIRFFRKLLPSGQKLRHYTHDLSTVVSPSIPTNSTLVATVAVIYVPTRNGRYMILMPPVSLCVVSGISLPLLLPM